MVIHITGAPCSWGVDDPQHPDNLPWKKVLQEAGEAGYKAIELGPYGYMPIHIEQVSAELEKNGLSIVAGTIFDDLVDEQNSGKVLKQTEDICSIITRLPPLPFEEGQRARAPYLTIMDWGHRERDYAAGHSDRAPRLRSSEWNQMMSHIRSICEVAAKWGVRPVIHPHAGGYIEFADEIDRVAQDIPYETAGLCLDTGHLQYSGMDPVEWLRKYADRLDYIHFKDINEAVYGKVMNEHISFFDGCAKGAMCPLGTGMIDYSAIYRLLTEELRYSGYITIEQERDPKNAETSLRDVKESLDYLKSIGF
ncbi:sugar phosphate isomerase/epimerase family protein [Domibacillus enclensis]|uniref:2-keto-myo-inositol dehydratase n=1 Tax=Domibacillus enclensis TaxID=1017273 RepID=A0A1N6N8N3_9BACI|nr:TIM barrel protein [Domibacillus enclensis]OXS79955.1 AP endonuclease [Domibacillus enclensis]SIP88392.1 2-keto-myo-inositol dehydratase [Domibacillus enclensis]